MTFEIFLESLHHALIDTAAALPFLFLAYLLMEAAEHYQSARMEKAISGMGKAGPLVGAALGCIPQCGQRLQPVRRRTHQPGHSAGGLFVHL